MRRRRVRVVFDHGYKYVRRMLSLRPDAQRLVAWTLLEARTPLERHLVARKQGQVNIERTYERYHHFRNLFSGLFR